MRKLFLRTGIAAIAIGALFGAVAPAASAASPTVAGTFTLADNGQGGWVGGALRTAGSISGGGAVSFSTPDGQFIERMVSGTWSSPAPGLVTISLNLVGVSALAPPTDNFTITLPVTGGPIKVTDPFGGTTVIRVRLF